MTHKQLAAAHRRRLKTMRKQLLAMSAQWDDVDQFNVNKLAELADQAEQLGKDLVDEGGGE